VEIVRRTTVGDVAADIADAVADAVRRTGAVITTGGLGPTSDDLTKPSIAALFGRSMTYDASVYARIEQRWRARGLPGSPPPANRQQAMVPDGAVVLTNHHGTAPGIWLEDADGRWVAMLPGVPREMRGMVGDTIVPRLRGRVPDSLTVVRSGTLRTTGIAESALAERLGDLGAGVEGMPLAYLPGEDGVDLRLTARGLPAPEAERLLCLALERLGACVGPYAYGRDHTDLAAVVLDACRRRGLHIGVGESCTAGMLGARLTAIPGSSDVFRGGVIAYDNALKHSLLGVPLDELNAVGAVSQEVAIAMAQGARAAAGSEIGVGITGIAGPDGGTPDKPVGTVWIAVVGPTPPGGAPPASSRRSIFGGDREEIRRRATQGALDMIRRAVLDVSP